MTTSERLPPNDWQQTEFPWMSSAADFRVRTSVLQDKARASMANALACGVSIPAILAKFDLNTSSWKTSQHCLDGDLASFSETWPRSGMMRNGIAYRLPPLALITSETVSGLLPTLTKHGNYNRKGSSKTSGDGLATVLKRMLPTLTKHDVRGGAKPERTIKMWEGSARRLRSAVINANSFPRDNWHHKPVLGGRFHGVSNRVDRIMCLGNAVVPQIPELIGRAIMDFEASR